MGVRYLVAASVTMIGALIDPTSVTAQAYPARPIRVIVPFAAGGPTDAVARLLSDKLAEKFKVSVVVDNRPSGSGAIAFQILRSSPADGHTLLFGTAGYVTVSPAISRKPVIDPLRDLTPVALGAKFNDLLVVANDLPVRSVSELIEYAKRNPGKVTCGSAGIGSFNHLFCEYFAYRSGIKLVHVPYKGTAPFLLDIAGGRLSMGSASIETSLPLAQSGRVRGLALGSPPAPGQPDYGFPTVASTAGMAGFDLATWGGFLGIAGLPREAVMRINEAVNEIIRRPEVLARYRDTGFEAVANTPEEFRAFLSKDLAQWREISRRAGIVID